MIFFKLHLSTHHPIDDVNCLMDIKVNDISEQLFLSDKDTNGHKNMDPFTFK